MSYVERFIKSIIELSEWSDWQLAKQEWDYVCSDEIHGSNCICGHPIVEVCTVRNRINNNIAEVGNCCVKKFMADTIISEYAKRDFQVLNGIRKNPLYTVNAYYVSDWYRSGVLTDWDFDFYMNIGRKRKLTQKQEYNKQRINNKIVASIKNKGYYERRREKEVS
jgi:hypothetical protein